MTINLIKQIAKLSEKTLSAGLLSMSREISGSKSFGKNRYYPMRLNFFPNLINGNSINRYEAQEKSTINAIHKQFTIISLLNMEAHI